MWSRESPLWLWAALAALLLVALIAGAIVAIAATDDKEGKGSSIPVVSTNPTTTDTVGVITQPPTFTINPGTTTAATTTLPTTQATTTTTTATTTGTILSWPAGKDGFTIVLRSVPKSQGRSTAEAEARRAISQGLPQVGVLDSSDYNSLQPGYWVVFSGIYDTKAQALSGLSTARSKYPMAYVREVAD